MLPETALLEVIHEWSFFDTPPSSAYIQREISLPKQLCDDLVLIIQGVRRGGKSTLLDQLPAYYNLPLEHCYYCNFEDPRLMDELNHELLTSIVKLARKKIPSNQSCYFFFDEIQHVLGWEKWLHTQIAKPKKNYFIVTGSNSALLSGEFGTALTGRHMTVELYPFSFSEYLKILPKGTLGSYLKSGGFPRTLTHDHPTVLLQDYFNDIILRDVLKRVNARSPESIKQVAKLAFDTCGSQLSYRKMAAITGLAIDTIQHYLEACEQAYLLFTCPFFTFSEKKRMARNKKFYPIDPGLRNAIRSTTSPELGKALEQLIFLKLKQQYDQIYYWESPIGGEVDFVTMEGKIITPYQVTWNEIKPRHEKGLGAFYETFQQANDPVFITQENAAQYL